MKKDEKNKIEMENVLKEVKSAVKIAYLGGDIQEAITLGILDKHLDELYELLNMDERKVCKNGNTKNSNKKSVRSNEW